MFEVVKAATSGSVMLNILDNFIVICRTIEGHPVRLPFPPKYGASDSICRSCMSISQADVLNLGYFFSMGRNGEIPHLQFGKAIFHLS